MNLGLVYLHLTVVHSNGQGQVHFNCEYIVNDKR